MLWIVTGCQLRGYSIQDANYFLVNHKLELADNAKNAYTIQYICTIIPIMLCVYWFVNVSICLCYCINLCSFWKGICNTSNVMGVTQLILPCEKILRHYSNLKHESVMKRYDGYI